MFIITKFSTAHDAMELFSSQCVFVSELLAVSHGQMEGRGESAWWRRLTIESYGMVDRRVTRKIALSGDDGGDYEAAGTG